MMQTTIIRLFSIFCCLFDLFVLLRYYSKFLKFRKERKFLFLSVLALLSILCFWLSSGDEYEILTVHIAVLGGLFLFSFVGSITEKLWLFLTSCVIAFLSVGVVLPLLLHGREFTNNALTFIVALSVTHIIFLLLAELLTRVQKFEIREVSLRVWIILLVIPTTTIAVLFCIVPLISSEIGGVHYFSIFFIVVGLLAINIMNFFAFDQFTKLTFQKKEKELIQQQIKIQAQHYKELESSYHMLRQVRHDLKNYQEALHHLISSESQAEVTGLVKSINHKLDVIGIHIYTGNTLLDAIITSKIREADNKNIHISCDIKIPQGLALTSDETIMIVSNLLDNAMEACQRLSDKKKEIKLKINYNRPVLFIHLENSCDNNSVLNYHSGRSSKGNQLNHGIGIRCIKQAVNNLDGTMEIQTKDNRFDVMIMVNVYIDQK